MTAPSAASPGPSRAVGLAVVAGLVQKRVDAVLAAEGLNFRKYGALQHIRSSPGISFSELARRFDITVQSMHTLIGSLVQAGWLRSTIERPGDPAELVITEAGQALLARIGERVQRIDSELFGETATPEWQRLGQAIGDVMRADLAPPRQ
ncbi:MarR family winged helix-turn-helix transcriptional regulator [Leucobacter sp. GX24907]